MMFDNISSMCRVVEVGISIQVKQKVSLENFIRNELIKTVLLPTKNDQLGFLKKTIKCIHQICKCPCSYNLNECQIFLLNTSHSNVK